MDWYEWWITNASNDYVMARFKKNWFQVDFDNPKRWSQQLQGQLRNGSTMLRVSTVRILCSENLSTLYCDDPRWPPMIQELPPLRDIQSGASRPEQSETALICPEITTIYEPFQIRPFVSLNAGTKALRAKCKIDQSSKYQEERHGQVKSVLLIYRSLVEITCKNVVNLSSTRKDHRGITKLQILYLQSQAFTKFLHNSHSVEKTYDTWAPHIPSVLPRNYWLAWERLLQWPAGPCLLGPLAGSGCTHITAWQT